MKYNTEGLKYYKPTHPGDPAGRERELLAAEVNTELGTYAANNGYSFDEKAQAMANLGARCMYDVMKGKEQEAASAEVLNKYSTNDAINADLIRRIDDD